MTTNQVLTDAEIADMAWMHYCNKHGFARAVEQAVLAKVPRFGGVWCSSDGEQGVTLDGHSYTRNDTIKRGVTEREARKRERAAFQAALEMVSAEVVTLFEAREYLDRRYPLPTCDKCGQELP